MGFFKKEIFQLFILCIDFQSNSVYNEIKLNIQNFVFWSERDYMKEVKCYRCGKVHELNYKTIKQTISCSHCHGSMTFDLKSIRKLKAMRYLFVVVIVSILMLGFQMVETMNSYTTLILTCMFAMVFSLWSDRLCLYATYRFMNVNYVECHPEDKKKNTKPKQKNKKRR